MQDKTGKNMGSGVLGPALPRGIHLNISIIKAPCKRPSLCLLRSKDRTSERSHIFSSLRSQSLLICSSTVEEKKENKLLILVSLFGHILDEKVTSQRKWGHLHSSSQKKGRTEAWLFLPSSFKNFQGIFTPHKSCFPSTTDQQLLHSFDGKHIILESPQALQIWGLLIHIPHSWGEGISHTCPAPIKETPRCKAEEDLHRLNYQRSFGQAGCNYLARNIIQDKDFRGDFGIH